jgi:hypothetical protein
MACFLALFDTVFSFFSNAKLGLVVERPARYHKARMAATRATRPQARPQRRAVVCGNFFENASRNDDVARPVIHHLEALLKSPTDTTRMRWNGASEKSYQQREGHV